MIYLLFMQSTKHLGRNLRDARELIGISQLDLAHMLGHKGGDAGAYISKLESGKHVPLISTLVKVAAKLGTTLEALLAK